MSRSFASIIFTLALIAPVAAHDNHDHAANSLGNPMWHYLTEPDHIGPTILIATVILVGMISVSRLRRTRRTAGSLTTD